MPEIDGGRITCAMAERGQELLDRGVQVSMESPENNSHGRVA
ncbi:MAG TPA: hypothetical protein PKD54_01440 [Pirellulaceae bacterium]|nr:hypothetical protein [Pirellulaceae bacterium]